MSEKGTGRKTVTPSEDNKPKRRLVGVEPSKPARQIRSGLSIKRRPEPEPADPPEVHPNRGYDPSAMVWKSRSDVGIMTGDVYELRFTEEAFDRFSGEKDPTKRTEKIARRMRIRSGIEVPSKADLANAFRMDFETFWRKLNGITLEGSRGKTIEEVANGVGSE
jgi:hypothetical protein